MPHTILVLASSPRINGNSEILADAFIAGAEKAGNSVCKISLRELRLQDCQGCDYCRSHRGKCILKDDMGIVHSALKKADILVFATPVHFFTFSTLLKSVIDRLHNELFRKSLRVRQTVLLAVCADKVTDVFQSTIDTYQAINHFLGWQSSGVITVPDVGEKGAIEGRKELIEAEKLGRSFV